MGRYVRQGVKREPVDVEPATRGFKRERIEDTFSRNFSMEGRVQEDTDKIVLTHAKWQETQDGYKLYETPYPYKGQEARRIYLEWQWTSDGQMWKPCGASFIHPNTRHDEQYVPRIARPPSVPSDDGSSHIDDNEL